MPNKGKGGYHRNSHEKARDRADIARLYLDNYTQRAIAHWIEQNRPYKLSISVINEDCQFCVQQWQEQATQAIDTIKARDLARLLDIETRASLAYERSLEMAERTLEESIRIPIFTKGVCKGQKKMVRRFERRTKSSVIREKQNGDPRWLAIIIECIRERREILGYAKPKKPDFIPPDDTDAKEHETNVLAALEKAYGKPQVTISVSSTVAVSAPGGVKVEDWRTKVK